MQQKGKCLYFNDRALAKGLLYAGEIKKISQRIKYFLGCSGVLSPSSIQSSFDDVILNNWQIIQKSVLINEISEMVKEAVKCQTLTEVEKKISAMQMTYLTSKHNQEIVDCAFKKNQTLTDIQAYLLELQKEHEEYKKIIGQVGTGSIFLEKNGRIRVVFLAKL